MSNLSYRTFFVLILLGVLFTLTACEKEFPAGPTFSLRSRYNRLSNNWISGRYGAGGDCFSLADGCHEWTILVLAEKGDFMLYVPSEKDTATYFGTWRYETPDQYFTLDFSSAIPAGTGLSDQQKMEIRRLRKNELWVRYTLTNGTNYTCTFGTN